MKILFVNMRREVQRNEFLFIQDYKKNEILFYNEKWKIKTKHVSVKISNF